MPSKSAAAVLEAPRELPEKADRMVKVVLRKAEDAAIQAQLGAALKAAANSLGWSLKELAAALERDDRQIARWLDGHEHVQLSRVWGVKALQVPFIEALSKFTTGCEVETTIRIRVVR